MVSSVKTTVIIQDELYGQLVEESREKHGSLRKVSETLNEILRNHFAKKNDYFGISKPFDTPFVRDKKDRI
ncbi:MAG: hypothetical protein Q8P02_03655 [Candidatus Micrarchaeota archaeon]|nr:hypothetical protein [Candidatus Micrarchaeota archaeon]